MNMCFHLLLTLAFSHIHPWCQTAFLELNNWFSSFTCLKPKMVYTNDWSSFVIWNKQTLICVPVFNGNLVFYGIPVSQYWNISSISIPVQTKYLHINLMSVYCPALTWLVSQLISKLLIYKHHLSVVVVVFKYCTCMAGNFQGQ